MLRKNLLLMMVSISIAVGGFWALQAQDPVPQNPRIDPPTVSAQTLQTDLSGTYTGTFNCDELGLTGDTTLTITGNEFTTADGKTGRIVASTTGGYTAVALQIGGTETSATTPSATPPTPPMIVSLRARKTGNRLTLSPAAGSTIKCSFIPARGMARGRRTPRTPAAVGTEVASPATEPSPVPAESPLPSQTPSPLPSPSPTESPTPTPSPTPGEPTPSPTPGEPMPSPTPGEPMPSPTPGEPMPSPTPGEPMPSPTPGEPMPSPTPGEPMPSPTPSPSPSPSPSPRPY